MSEDIELEEKQPLTNKELFDKQKADFKNKKRQIKLLKFMRENINKDIVFGGLGQEEKTSKLSQLKELENILWRTKRNKNGSNAYEFTPNKYPFNRSERRRRGIV